MTITAVAGPYGFANNKTSGTTLACANMSATTAGDSIFVLFASDDATGTYSVADSVGNSYSEVTPPSPTTNATHVVLRIFRSDSTINRAANASITVTHPTLTARAVVIGAFTGAATGTDGSNEGTGTGTAATSGNLTPTVNNCLLVGANAIEGPVADSNPTPAGWTNISSDGTTGAGGASNIAIRGGYIIETTATLQAYNPTIASNSWAAAIVAVQAAGAVGRVPYYRPYTQLLAQ